jgi:uncharacterized RDD family membrane protein YckC
MSAGIQFETPENVQISYKSAGLGHRFIAWLIDQIIVFLIGVVLFFGILFVGAIAGGIVEEILNDMGDKLQESQTDPQAQQQLILIFAGIGLLIWSFSSLIYYTAAELFLRGQTIGKRQIGLRVVKANGFALDSISIFVRNVFRLIDHLQLFWIVPVLSRRGQRFGDMVAGTLVVFDRPAPLCRVREELAVRNAADARFRFDHASLKRLRPVDYEAVEQILDRWDDVPPQQLESLLDTILDPLARRLKVEAPLRTDRLQFLEDLLAAEYRRQSRSLA